LFVGNLQPLAPPQPLDPLVVHQPTRISQHRGRGARCGEQYEASRWLTFLLRWFDKGTKEEAVTIAAEVMVEAAENPRVG
jgi:hypothetical protein